MQVAHPIWHQMRHICFQEDINGEALAWTFDHRDLQLFHDATASAIRAEEILRSHSNIPASDFVLQNGCNTFVILLEGDKFSVPSALETVQGGVSY